MSPDPPTSKDSSQTPEGSTPLIRSQSSVRALLGMPDSGEHPVLSAVGRPLVEFSYVASQATTGSVVGSDDQWFDSEFEIEAWTDANQMPATDRQNSPSKPSSTRTESTISPKLEAQESNRQTLNPADQEGNESPITPIAETAQARVSPQKKPQQSREVPSAETTDSESTTVTIPGVTPRASVPNPLSAIPEGFHFSETQISVQPANAPDRFLNQTIREPFKNEESTVERSESTPSGQADQISARSIDLTTGDATRTSTPVPLPAMSSDVPLIGKESGPAIRASALIPMPEASQGDLAAIVHRSAQTATEQIAQLRQAVADLTAQVAAQQANQQQASPVFFPHVEPVAKAEHPTPIQKTSQAFWERSYLSRLYRWSHR